MSRPRACELSAALERHVNPPGGMFITVSDTGIWWVITDDLDAADVAGLDLALTLALDDGYTAITTRGLVGRFQGVPVRVAYEHAPASTPRRHLEVVS